ncbi:MAG: OmpA family protein [Saprospiraceae bacterium]|jgi:outer membrane protein OmpA-like peptidoglycan-associated protein|nr:OmpA family protein [Saprospiraceae bacterium]
MKKLSFLFVLLSFSFNFLMSQNADYKSAVGLSGRIGNGDALNDIDFDMAHSHLNIDGMYGRNFTNWLNVTVPVGASLSMNNTLDDKFIGLHGDILAQIGMFDRSRVAAPYLYLGPSFSLSKDFVKDELNVFEIAARAGVGVNIKIANQFLVGISAGYNNSFKENQKGFLDAGIGVYYLFGASGKDKPLSMRKLNKLDSDGDGIPDINDECPHTAGVAAFNGCPDSDNDGIPDYMDKCPDQPGPKTTMGCPDKDGDGVPDNEDKCPDIAGDAKYFGCPFVDSDGDGVPDNEDLCPDVKGLVRFKGCPDTDGDGVPDNIDKCKDKAGTIEAFGCPDTDGDGIPDHEDKCPTVAGVPELKGCPAANQADINIMTNAARNVTWNNNAFALSFASQSELDKVASVLKKNKKYMLTVTGYSDENTPAGEVTELSQSRAEEVKTYLISKGIEAKRITTKAGKLPVISTRRVLFDLK